MSSSIVPASQVPREEIAAYLVSQGHSPEIAAWKYFDDAFNQGRNRGWAWLKDGAVAGFIGFLPFEIGNATQKFEARWLCDWSVADYESNRGAGVRLFKRALKDGTHMVLGGNANSLGPMEKMASRTRHAADTELRLFLRSGALLSRLPARVPGASTLARGPLGRIAVPRKKPRASSEVEVAVRSGISRDLSPLLESVGEKFRAIYDHKYLSWQIGRCPTLASWSVVSRRAGLAMWHPKSSRKVWRAALWLDHSAPTIALREADAVLREAVSHAFRQGAHEISFVASRSDEAEASLMQGAGFSPTKTARPLFLYDAPGEESVALDDLRGLSFVATDLSYRF